MSWIESALTRWEARLRELIEGEPPVDGIGRKFHNQMVRKLFMAMKAGIQRLPDEQNPDDFTFSAPDQYTLILPAEEAQLLLTHPTELDQLSRILENTAARSGIVFVTAPIVRVVADPQSTEMKVGVEFRRVGVKNSSTTQVEGMQDGVGNASNGIMPKAFLIINGLTTYPLIEPVVNIGRDPTNHVHLDDLRVSRTHAQLRLIQGRFVIFDLDSMGGTFVNDVAVTSHVLNPGDVILMAGVPLVYGQEEVAQVGYTQELPADPPTPEVL